MRKIIWLLPLLLFFTISVQSKMAFLPIPLFEVEFFSNEILIDVMALISSNDFMVSINV